jgi:photosystem II stability/assembly factor-like uncharacterized protein
MDPTQRDVVMVAPKSKSSRPSGIAQSMTVSSGRLSLLGLLGASSPARRKVVALAGAVALLLLSGYLSWRQPTPGQNDPQTSFLENPLKGFFYPIEVNPQFRPPTYPANWFFYPWAVSPERRPNADYPYLPAIAAAPGSGGRTLVAVGGGSEGTILHTANGGATWNPEHSGMSVGLLGVAFANTQTGWAVGCNDTILHTTDGGVTWNLQRSGTNGCLSDLAFTDAQTGWAVGSGGTILHTTDGGDTWNHQRSGTNEWLVGVAFTDAQTGWAVGNNGAILHTTDGGATWNTERSGINFPLTAVAFTDARTGWVVDSHGGILHTTDGGATWNPQRSGPANGLIGVAFTDAQTGWVVGIGGTILHTTDGGATWDPQRSGVTYDELGGVAFADARTGWVVGSGGNILHTTDGGVSWHTQEGFRYRKYPAPWFYAAILLLLPVFYWSLRPERISTAAIQDIVTADAPVESLEGDRLGRRSLVERLSGLIVNPNTQAPLVITLQAPWGMGKTSVMRMMQSHLENKYRATTIWFNAWHHQKEDLLLAYLMETIQKEAVPQWISLRGPVFRLKLIAKRLVGKGQLDRLALVLAGMALFYLSVFHPKEVQSAFGNPEWMQNQWVKNLVPLLALLPAWNVLVAFKSNPEKMTDKSGGFLVDTFKELIRLPSLVGKSDVRQEFANNLKDVVAALKPHRLVIFLDDLDRCRPEQVIQILEAINFLGSVANCFLIVGADYKRVETLVANEFETIALREKENEEKGKVAADTLALRVEERMKFARNYLKKIVNLRIDLAKPTGFKALLTNEPETKIERTEPTKQPWWTLIWKKPLLLGSALAGVLLVAGVTWWAVTLVARQPGAGKAAGLTQSGGNVSAGPTQSSGNVSAGPTQSSGNVSAGLMSSGRNVSGVAPPQDGGDLRNAVDFGVPLLVAFLALIGWYHQPPSTEESKDADSFTMALEESSGQIFARCGKSPREARRFLNYLRLVGNDPTLRAKYGGEFDRSLVGLAVTGKLDDPQWIPEVKLYYEKQCKLFGLDPETFRSLRETRETS